ncbi:hypothetical protein EDD86DRAFT_203289 [Gorgonomyces haynaldii]|nr:hypothetical protein EDD86DRAFT_203289 [Gorgonomyces haynaldii]
MLRFVRRFSTKDPQQIVKTAVEQFVECNGNEWQQVQFASLPLKFKIVDQTIKLSQKTITNSELSELRNATELAALLQNKFENEPYENMTAAEEVIARQRDKLGKHVFYSQ